MIESIITSKTRIRLLLKLFLNSSTQCHLRAMERDFGESNNAIRQELKRLLNAKMITFTTDKGKKLYRANTQHPLFNDIQSILRKTVGIDQIVENVTSRIGNLESAFLTGSFAEGVDSDTIELVLVGNNLDEAYIKNVVAKAEKLVERNIVYLVLTNQQIEQFFNSKPLLLIWEKEEEAGSRKHEAGSWKLEAGSWKHGAGIDRQ